MTKDHYKTLLFFVFSGSYLFKTKDMGETKKSSFALANILCMHGMISVL